MCTLDVKQNMKEKKTKEMEKESSFESTAAQLAKMILVIFPL